MEYRRGCSGRSTGSNCSAFSFSPEGSSSRSTSATCRTAKYASAAASSAWRAAS